VVWGYRSVSFSEARAFIGQTVELEWIDTIGRSHVLETTVQQISLIPQQGPCFITTEGSFALDHVTECRPSKTDVRIVDQAA